MRIRTLIIASASIAAMLPSYGLASGKWQANAGIGSSVGNYSAELVSVQVSRNIGGGAFIGAELMSIGFDRAPGELPSGSKDNPERTSGLMINVGYSLPLGSMFSLYGSTGIGAVKDTAQKTVDSFFCKTISSGGYEVCFIDEDSPNRSNPFTSNLTGQLELGVSYSDRGVEAQVGYRHLSSMNRFGDGLDMISLGLGYQF